jgi:hypothetical protein
VLRLCSTALFFVASCTIERYRNHMEAQTALLGWEVDFSVGNPRMASTSIGNFAGAVLPPEQVLTGFGG